MAQLAERAGHPHRAGGSNGRGRSTDGRDDLTRIRGIGKQTQLQLYDAGVTTYEQLAELDEADIPELAERTGLPESKLRNGGWQDGARHRLRERQG
jgi:predicted flap endonuclease-1-like 5' DNA nuclease